MAEELNVAAADCAQSYELISFRFNVSEIVNEISEWNRMNDEVDVETVARENRRMQMIADKKLSSCILSEQTVLSVSSKFIDSGLVDDDDIAIVNEALSVFAYRQPNTTFWKMCVSSILLALMSYALMCGIFLNLSTSWKCAISLCLSLALCSASSHFSAWFLIERLISYYIHSANRFDEGVQQILSMLHFVDMYIFGLIPHREYLMKQHRFCLRTFRVDFLETLREAVSKQQHASDAICSADEKEYLLWASLTPEMAALVSTRKRREEFLNLASLKELWQFYFMLRSEFIRLFLLNMFDCSSVSKMFASLVDLYGYARNMNRHSSRMLKVKRIMDRASIDCVKDYEEDRPEKQNRQLMARLEPIDKACVRLRVAYDILSSSKDAMSNAKDRTVDDVVRILKEVINNLTDAKCIEDSSQVEAGKGDAIEAHQREDSPSRQTGGIQEIGRNRTPLEATAPSSVTVDQMFEAMPYADDSHRNCTAFETEEVDENVKASTKSVLNELQCALLDRKRAMKKRERIALKRFYKKQAVVCGGETNGKNPHLADGNADEDEIDSDWYSRNLDSSETDDDSSIAEEVCDDRVDSDEEDKQQFDDGENSSSSDRQMLSARCKPDSNLNSSKTVRSVFGASFGEALRRRAVEPQQTFGDSDTDSLDAAEGEGNGHSCDER